MDAELVEKVRDLDPGTIIVIDGFSGSGKTRLAQRLSSALNIQYIDTDCYVVKQSDSESYLSLLDMVHLKEVVGTFIKREKSLIFSGICVC